MSGAKPHPVYDVMILELLFRPSLAARCTRSLFIYFVMSLPRASYKYTFSRCHWWCNSKSCIFALMILHPKLATSDQQNKANLCKSEIIGFSAKSQAMETCHSKSQLLELSVDTILRAHQQTQSYKVLKTLINKENYNRGGSIHNPFINRKGGVKGTCEQWIDFWLHYYKQLNYYYVIRPAYRKIVKVIRLLQPRRDEVSSPSHFSRPCGPSASFSSRMHSSVREAST